MSLTELQCRKAKPAEKVYRLSDGNGLCLEVRPAGQKYWIVRMWSGGKEIRRSLGKFPDIGLKEARAKNVSMRNGAVPSSGDLFGTLLDEWLERKVEGILAPGYVRVIRLRVERFIRPALGRLRITDVSSAKILSLCRIIEDGGTVETAHRVRQLIGQAFRYAIATDRAENDPTVALRGALKPAPNAHYATILSPEAIGSLMRAIDAYQGVLMRLALLFSIYTFARPGEVRRAEWAEIDQERREWKIPPEKMKMKRPHIVPMSTQLVRVVKDLRMLTGNRRWLFPSARSDDRPMSDNGVRTALRSIGYRNEDITPHGFRAMASTILNENGWPPDVIERQLAHIERNAVRAAYNHAEHLEKRREMVQWWGNWLDTQKAR
jgi:integrase